MLNSGNGIQFTVTGVVSGAGCTSTTPDGCSNFFSNSAGTGVARYSGPAQALVGIFLDASTPSGPGALTFFAATNSATFSPDLLQPSFIGDGLTGTGSGTIQNFIVPTGASRLFLAISDNPGFFYDNGGSFNVSVNDGVALTNTQILSQAPEPSSYLMVGTVLTALTLLKKTAKQN